MNAEHWTHVRDALNHYVAHLHDTRAALEVSIFLAEHGWDIKDIEIKREQLPLVQDELFRVRATLVELEVLHG